MKNKVIFFRKTTLLLLSIVAVSFIFSCDDSLFRDDLPDAGSQVDNFLPTADFSYTPGERDFNTIQFTNLATESTTFLWDFGTGDTSTEKDPVYKFAGGEGDYNVTLTASDNNGMSATTTIVVEVVDRFVPINPEVLNGDMEDSSNNWRIDFSNGWSRFGFESSSDGSWLLYDGTDNGAKTRGAKWNMRRSAAEWANPDTRHAYQAIVVSPNWEYTLEFEYAIKDDIATDPIGGRRMVAEILDGHFTDGVDAYNQSIAGGALVTHVGTEVKGKTTFTQVKVDFTSNDSGLVSIWLWAVTPVDLYVDNVKVYPRL
ncbi:PKD domain-containing protein [Sabulilitoribacter multivorans]|uniref:PKD domain-containing protein n=1 Tax=Flaviramulus multivorans TaxID=1304750 RepID=A0ABS9IJ67_9FLAO|nr:PKD domain-containing protein [Flaviramulus multivorans]MCF7560620.1 PKD domain-containing protein [Flaviramulus multivorans]